MKSAPDSNTTTTHDTAIILTPPVLKVLWVAMTAMVKDFNGPQVMLTPSEWEIAEKVLKDLDEKIDNAT